MKPIKFRIKPDLTIEIVQGSLFAVISNGEQVSGNHTFAPNAVKAAMVFSIAASAGDRGEYVELPTAQEVADTIIAEIKTHPELMACSSFSELHDHCDANVLGCAEELLDLTGMSTAIDILNEAQTVVTAFLSSK